MDNTKQNEYNLSNLDFSKLQPYSLGIVVRDIKLGEDTIDVYPIEKLPDAKEDLTENKNPLIVELKDNCGNKETIIIHREQVIKAKWLSINQYNRMTPPTIRKGEFVLLYRFSNADIFYWDTLFNDPRMRKEEVVVHAFSDKPEMDLNETLDNMYYIKVDTKNKEIHFHTTDKYGEACTYDITLNTKEGTLILKDGLGNTITLNSPSGSLTITTNTNVNIFSPTVTVQSALTSVISGVVDVRSHTTTIQGSNKVTIKGGKVDINP